MRGRKLLAFGASNLIGSCIALSPSFSGETTCPVICTRAGGLNPGNWTVYHSVERLNYCNSSMILSFSAFSPLDDLRTGKTLRACAVDPEAQSSEQPAHGHYFKRNNTTPNSPNPNARSINETIPQPQQHVQAQALWNDDSSLLEVDIAGIGDQLQSFLDTLGASDTTAVPRLIVIYNPNSFTAMGIYADAGITMYPMIGILSDLARSQGYFGDLLVQSCNANPEGDVLKANSTSLIDAKNFVSANFGIVASSGLQSLVKVQHTLRQWANSTCVTQGYSQASTLPTVFPRVVSTQSGESASSLDKRGTCSTVTVQSGDLCGSLAKRCGITTNQLLQYNGNSPEFCTSLRVPQLVCCSEGSLPVPEADSNGNCKFHEVHAEESCWSIANDNSFFFSVNDLEDFNKNTWGWGGCNNLQAGAIICLSPGNPPLPKPVPNAMCGPVKPGTVAPPPGTDIASLNPCPLNACCDVWGFCGTTEEFCLPVPAGQAPGAPQPLGAPNCISNCGTDIVNNGSPPSSFISIGYFEGYAISRKCQAVDIRNIDISKYTHIHFAFATVTPGGYEVDMGATINQYYYFKRISGAKKILSFGGWSFSTDPGTYGIFRQGVLSSNRDRMAQNIANFIMNEGLDGVDIDWEYPAAPDLPDIPTADPQEGENYYLFLKTLRSILPSSKSISFAAPASFWYLRGFPVAKIIDIVDYVVYMTYDLHGQWDYGNKWTDSACPGGNCLRSHLNLTETMNALSMITKAGVPTHKIAVGIASYGRSFEMTEPHCTTPMCTYTGRQSGATPGRCTGTTGYISNAEIREILATDPTARSFSDGEGADILVYNNNQWVSYMSDDTKTIRVNMYREMNFLGTTDWAISLDDIGLIDQDSTDDDLESYADNSGDLGLGQLPGLVLKDKGRKLGKGAVQPSYHSSCSKYKKSMQQSWREAGEIADVTIKYTRNNQFQRVLEIYFGSESYEESSIFFNNFQRLWESHWGVINRKRPESLGMGIHVKFFCGGGEFKEIWGKGYHNTCPLRKKAKLAQAATTYQIREDWKKKSDIFTVYCEHATHHPNTISLSDAEDEADDYHYHLTAINMWQQQVRPFVFYHENMHWKRVSRPWCGRTIGTRKDGEAVEEKYRLKDVMRLPYEMRKRNAENWSLAAIAMWVMYEWGVGPPLPGESFQERGEPEETRYFEDDDDDEPDLEYLAAIDAAEKAFQENYDPARVDPADFTPLFDEDDVAPEFPYDCVEDEYFTTFQCGLICQGGLCTETFDGFVICSGCNSTVDQEPYKREEFRDTFDNESMSEWKVYKGQFHVSQEGLTGDSAAEGEAIIYRHKSADFIFEADVTFPDIATSGDAGLMFRATHPNQAKHGYLVGSFYAGFSPSSGRAFLNLMPSNEELASATIEGHTEKTIHMKVQAINETISIYVDNMETPKLVHKDKTFETGFNGVYIRNASATFSNVAIIPLVRQQGILENCAGFYRAVAGDTCQTILDEHKSISLAQLHSWNPALQNDCAGLKTDYFYCVESENVEIVSVSKETAFTLRTKFHNDCTGQVYNDDVVLSGDEGKCVNTGCSVASLDIAADGNCASGNVQISYWERPGCSGKLFGYGYASRDACRSLWSSGWSFESLHLRCADPQSDCLSQGTCKADEEPTKGICEATLHEEPSIPLPAFKLEARYHFDCTGDVEKELSVQHGNGLCLNTGCNVGSLNISELGDCPEDQVRISYWGGDDCAGAWYGYGYASRNTCRTLWSGGTKFKSLWLSCAKQSDDCISQDTCTIDPEPENLC